MVRFLESHPPYKQYVTDVKTGVLKLPAYDKDSDGSVIVLPEEIFCRFKGCNHQREYSHPGNLKTHLTGHQGVTVSGKYANRGRHTIDEMGEVKTWYTVLVANTLAKPRLPFTKGKGKNRKISVKAVRDFLATEHIHDDCNVCTTADLKCGTTPFTCEYLSRFWDVEADFERLENDA